MSFLSQRHSIIFYRVIISPGHGKEVFDGLNVIDKRYMYQSMSNIQLPGSKRIYSQILTHSCTPKLMSVWINDSKNICIRMIINMDSLIRKKYRKIKWTDREYHVQDNDDVPHKYVKNYCDTNQFPTLPFCGSHPKPHGARGWVSIIIYVLIQIYFMTYV